MHCALLALLIALQLTQGDQKKFQCSVIFAYRDQVGFFFTFSTDVLSSLVYYLEISPDLEQKLSQVYSTVFIYF